MTITTSPEHTIILAKTRHIEELQRQSSCLTFVEHLGRMIHQLQAERGASCLYLAAHGQQFAEERADLIIRNLALESGIRQLVQQHLQDHVQADARQLSLISWSLLGLSQLTALRHQITLQQISFAACLESYSRLIDSLIALIFAITDNPVNSQLSTCLLAFYNLVQAKEFAGQERAIGSHLFGSGKLQPNHRQTLLELVSRQAQHIDVFCQFVGEDLRAAINDFQTSATSRQQQQCRDKLISAQEQQALKPDDAAIWFALCSQQQENLWRLQCQVIQKMREMLTKCLHNAGEDLRKAREYLQVMASKTSAPLDSTFFNLAIPVEDCLRFHTHDSVQGYPLASMISLLQQQSRQIAEMESELSSTKKVLAERKQIERAKGLLMSQNNLTEMEAYKALRSSAMAQNRKIIDVAENLLAQQKQAC